MIALKNDPFLYKKLSKNRRKNIILFFTYKYYSKKFLHLFLTNTPDAP